MVIGADVMTSIIDYEDRATCILFGDAAGAVILEPREDGTGILDFAHEVDGSGAPYLSMPGGGSLHPTTHETVDRKMHTLKQQGQHVFKYAVRKFADTSEQILLRNDFTGTDVDLFVAHQANIRIIEAAQHRMGLPDSKVDQEHPRVRQHDGGHHPARDEDGPRPEEAREGEPGAPRRGRGGLHRRLGAAPLVRGELGLVAPARRRPRRTRARPWAR